jgi:prepilin-type N-terminal cleavage/methylation domain-containing protein
MWRCNARKQNFGFTLIEMLATAAMVSILAAIAVPSLLGMYNRYRQEESMREIEGALKEAQRQAVRSSKTCEITFTQTTVNGETRGFITTNDAANNGCLLSNRTMYSEIIVEGKAKDSSISTDITTAPIPITFSSKGNTANNSQGVFIISHSQTNIETCVQIEGLLGNIITGTYDGTTCNSN